MATDAYLEWNRYLAINPKVKPSRCFKVMIYMYIIFHLSGPYFMACIFGAMIATYGYETRAKTAIPFIYNFYALFHAPLHLGWSISLGFAFYLRVKALAKVGDFMNELVVVCFHVGWCHCVGGILQSHQQVTAVLFCSLLTTLRLCL